MFTTLSLPAHTYMNSHHYTPTVSSPLSSSPLRQSLSPSSPLSPRDANLPTPTRGSIFSPHFSHDQNQNFNLKMSPTPTITPGSKKPRTPSTASSSRSSRSTGNTSTSSRESTFSKRATKPNPLLESRGSGDGRETRRKLFLKRVREGGEDKRWEARGGEEEMMRLIWVQEEGRRREALRRDAAQLGEEEVGDGMEGDGLWGVSFEEVEAEAEAEEAARREQEELDALVEGMMGSSQNLEDREMSENIFENQQLPVRQQDTRGEKQRMGEETPFGSDDEEYDSIFMDVIQEEQKMSSQQLAPSQDADMMDMS